MKIKIVLLVIAATTVACADSPEKQAQNYYKRCGAHEPKPGNIVFVGGSRATVVDIQMRKNTTMPPQILVVIDGALASFDCTEIKQ